MAIFAATFRLREDNTYNERLDSMIAAMKRCFHGPKYWDEPTSFYLFENPSSSQKIADFVRVNSKFDPSKDLLLIINLTEKAYAPIGKITDDSIYELMKKR